MTAHDTALALAQESHDRQIAQGNRDLDRQELELVEDLWADEWAAQDDEDRRYESTRDDRLEVTS